MYILTDIEGTTTSISFVKDTLFPYFSANLLPFYADLKADAKAGKRNATLDAFDAELSAVIATVAEETKENISEAEALNVLLHWTETDRKHPALKNLQGIIWREAYQKPDHDSQAIRGHLYPDVPVVLRYWRSEGFRIGIYSSGSVEAQRLLFKHSVFGDLSDLVAHYFDTAVGHKREAASYRTIAKTLGLSPRYIVFLSDVVEELDAAAEAGLNTIQLLREDTAATNRHLSVTSFMAIEVAPFGS